MKSISLVENGDAELTNNSEDAVVVKIATTQDKGDLKVSHNKYDEFSTKNEDNVILNNNTNSEYTSKIDNKTKIDKNENLKGTAAELIINEVTSFKQIRFEGNL